MNNNFFLILNSQAYIFSMKFLRTMAQLRKDYNIALPKNADSEYKEIVREERVFPSLMISKV